MDKVHVLPIGDVREHDEYGEDCLCNPRIEDEVVVHNSFDGREHFEPNHDEQHCKFCQTEPISIQGVNT